jgi:hypothetical protein
VVLAASGENLVTLRFFALPSATESSSRYRYTTSASMARPSRRLKHADIRSLRAPEK